MIFTSKASPLKQNRYSQNGLSCSLNLSVGLITNVSTRDLFFSRQDHNGEAIDGEGGNSRRKIEDTSNVKYVSRSNDRNN